MIDLSKEVWVEKDIEGYEGVKAKFKLIKFKEFKVIVDTDGNDIVFGRDSAKEALDIIARSIKDVEGIVIKKKVATYKDLLEHGSMNLVAAFFAAFISVQQDNDFLTK